MWHPERYSKFKTIDKKIFRKFYDSYNVMQVKVSRLKSKTSNLPKCMVKVKKKQS